MFKFYQPNKKQSMTGDCVVRALCKATGREWLDVFDELIIYSKDMQVMPSSKLCYEKFLRIHNFTYTGISNKKGTKRPTVDSFSKEHKQGIFVLIVANHLVTSFDGNYYDTWDSGHKSLYGYWTKN